jgi:hypothetical protein
MFPTLFICQADPSFYLKGKPMAQHGMPPMVLPLIEYVSPEGRKGAFDPEAVTGISEQIPYATDVGKKNIPYCFVFCGNHGHAVAGTYEEIMAGILGFDDIDTVPEKVQPGNLPREFGKDE